MNDAVVKSLGSPVTQDFQGQYPIQSDLLRGSARCPEIASKQDGLTITLDGQRIYADAEDRTLTPERIPILTAATRPDEGHWPAAWPAVLDGN